MPKTHDNRRKEHVTQLKRMNRRKDESGSSPSNLSRQYLVIRDDLVKLRNDLSQGYSMAKSAVEKKTILSELMKLKESL